MKLLFLLFIVLYASKTYITELKSDLPINQLDLLNVYI